MPTSDEQRLAEAQRAQQVEILAREAAEWAQTNDGRFPSDADRLRELEDSELYAEYDRRDLRYMWATESGVVLTELELEQAYQNALRAWLEINRRAAPKGELDRLTNEKDDSYEVQGRAGHDSASRDVTEGSGCGGAAAATPGRGGVAEPLQDLLNRFFPRSPLARAHTARNEPAAGRATARRQSRQAGRGEWERG